MKRYKHHIIHQSLTLLFAIFVAQGAVAQSTLKGISIVDASEASIGEQYREENAIDGNKETFYRTRGSKRDTYLLLNVGNDYAKVNSIEFYVKNTDKAADKVTIYSSNTNRGDNPWNWKNEESVEIDNFNNQDTHTIPITLQGRYVYIHMEANSGRQFDISELTFYVTPEVETEPETENRYNTDYQNITIRHKPAKWYDIRKNLTQAPADDFDNGEDAKMDKTGNGIEIQATHTLIDTIYVHRGTVTRLTIQDFLGETDANNSYQRWYNFENDGLFRYEYNRQTIDLLTPARENLPGPGNPNTAYRFANGYVGEPVAGKGLIAMDFYFPDNGKNAYYVACDLSGYQDFTPEYNTSQTAYTQFGRYGNDEYWEPTLTHRYLFYIRAIENENSWAYKQYNHEEGARPIQDMEITFPATRIPNHTHELVALSMDAQSYLTPDGSIHEAAQELSVSLTNNTAGITLETTSLSGTDRIIHFSYPDSNNDGTKTVNIPTDGSKPQATIEVKRGNYVAARFKLTFDESARLLSQSQLQLISDNEDQYGNLSQDSQGNNAIKGTILEQYANRTPKFLKNNYELLTEMNFDYATDIGKSYGQSQSYPYPLGWDDISYGFYDGSNGHQKTLNEQVQEGTSETGWANGFKTPSRSYCPEWGYYGILNTYVESGEYGWANTNIVKPNDAEEIRKNSEGNQSTYHLYADTSDRPGTIARLPFTEPLCNGTELFITAWVKCARSNSGKDNAAALFSIMGVKTENVPGVGDRTTYVPIHRFQTGQIPFTLHHGRSDDGDPADPRITSTGYNQSENDWMQVYFSFINDADADYESYVLQVDNNSGSTDGGDIYIDDIRVYIATPDAKITQLEATCTNERTMTNIQLDWERLTQRLGVNTNASEVGDNQDPVTAFDYCFVDAKTYNDYLAEHPNDYAGAIEAAVVEIGDNVDYNQKYVTIYFHNIFEKNKAAEVNAEGTVVHPNLLVENKQAGNYYLYSMTERGDNYLTGDFYAAFTPNREYWMLMKPHSDNGTVDAYWFAEDIASPCAIRTPFDVSAQTLIRVNGQVTVPTSDYCAGQVLNFSAQVRVPTGEKDETGLPIYDTVDGGVYFDWFFGTADEFIAQNDQYGNETLEMALKTLREIPEYREKKDLEGVTAGTYQAYDGSTVELTENMINLIRHYLEAEAEQGGLNRPLILHESSLNITLLDDGLQLVVQPIPVLQSPDPDIEDDMWQQVCWSYVPLTLSVNSEAPGLHAGFNGYTYPSEHLNPNLRIGLDQIELATNESTPLTISLRGATYTTEDVDRLGIISNDPNGKDYKKIYLISTDDPAYRDFFSDEEGGFDQLSLPIGTLQSLVAHIYTQGTTGEDNIAKVVFDTSSTITTADGKQFKFTPREGYTYTFTIHYQEIMRRGAQASTACYGSLSIPMMIVPKYLVWQGKDGTANWNNDENWKRADKDELKKTANDSYETNTQNTTDNGFVPMLFSNVVMPANSQVHLYMAGYDKGEGENDEWYWNNTEEFARPEGMEAPTENIQYDLMAFEQNQGNSTTITTQRYRVNLCNDIHFEPGAQMLHAEQLIYNKAWMDITLPVDSWTAISTPLQDIVAGDWYTQTATGTQETPYFEDITFNNTDYNRLKPAVYQRSWSSANIVGQSFNGSVSFQNNWSAAYNDASVPYLAGEGYSISGRPVGNSNTLVFRMPKADTSYDLASDSFSRDNAGKMLIGQLYDRSNPESLQTNNYISVNLTAANGDGNYLMVGNPYMAELDVQRFLEANKDVLAQKYTYVNAAGENATASYNTETSKWETNGVEADNAFIKPYGVFYALPLPDGATSATVKFSESMQRLTPVASTETPEEGTGATTAMHIEATSERGTSKASVNYSSTASDNYLRTEDAALLTGIGENAAPRVFTAADNMAITVNQLQGQTRIPLGVYADDNEAVTLTFHNMDGFREPALYDAKNQTSTPLYDGYQVMVTGDNFGQYFITSKGPLVTGIENVETAEDEIQVNSMIHRQVVVTANSGIEEITIYSANGTLLRRVTPAGDTTCTIDGVASGVAVVMVKTANNNDTFKIIIK